MTWSKLSQLLLKDPSLTRIFSMTLKQLSSLFHPALTHPQVFYHDLHRHSPEVTLYQYSQHDIHAISFVDQEYPLQLKQIYDPPWVILAKGDKQLLHTPKPLGVVGTRKATELGLKSIQTLFPRIVQEGFVIVSGMAKGIDRLAHIEAIKQNGKTIAVMGSGFQFIYPKENLVLYEHLVTEHLVITEYPPSTSPQKWQFPARNRIISGLSKGLLVIEAAERSGSLISADQALEQGRDVFAAPGPLFSPLSKGTNRLIQQGAKLVLTAEDIIEEYEAE
ncbi:DNA-processing protein DprA [Alkalihalobacillus sp. NPDC078783]